MNKLKKYIYKKVLKKISSKKCKNRILRSGDGIEKVNCYVYYLYNLDNDSKPEFLFKRLKNEKVICYKWNGKQFNKESYIELSIEDIEKYNSKFYHYYGSITIEYTSFNDFVFHCISKLIYIKIYFQRKYQKLMQYFFNKKELTSKSRIELLKLLLDMQLDDKRHAFDSSSSISMTTIIYELYTIKIYGHPQSDRKLNELDMNLKSLLETVDLTQNSDSGYYVTAKALKTIEEYEQEERRHNDNLNLQRIMGIITTLIMLFTAVQALK